MKKLFAALLWGDGMNKCANCGKLFVSKSPQKMCCSCTCDKELKRKRMQKTAETVNKIMKTIPQKMENGKELRQCVNCGKWFEPCRTTFDESGKCLNVCGEFTCSYDCTEELSRKDVI